MIIPKNSNLIDDLKENYTAKKETMRMQVFITTFVSFPNGVNIYLVKKKSELFFPVKVRKFLLRKQDNMNMFFILVSFMKISITNGASWRQRLLWTVSKTEQDQKQCSEI